LLRPQSDGFMDICFLIDNVKGFYLGPGDIMVIFNFITDQYYSRGFTKFNTHCFVFTDNVERDKVYADSPLSFWLIDTIANRLLIYEGQPEDVFLFKKEFENSINKKLPSVFNNHLPYITIFLVAINILVFLYTEISGSSTDTLFMLNHGASYWKYIFDQGEYYRLFTSIFLHFGGEHLLNNMIILSVIGYEVEYHLGHLRYLIIYLLSGIGAGIVSAVYYMNSYPDVITVSAGASGAIFGIIGSLLIIVLTDKQIRHKLRPTNLIFIIILSILNGFNGSSVDNMAHIGGLMFGIILTFISCLCYKCIIKYKR